MMDNATNLVRKREKEELRHIDFDMSIKYPHILYGTVSTFSAKPPNPEVL